MSDPRYEELRALLRDSKAILIEAEKLRMSGLRVQAQAYSLRCAILGDGRWDTEVSDDEV